MREVRYVDPLLDQSQRVEGIDDVLLLFHDARRQRDCGVVAPYGRTLAHELDGIGDGRFSDTLIDRRLYQSGGRARQTVTVAELPDRQYVVGINGHLIGPTVYDAPRFAPDDLLVRRKKPRC
ncbi:hypothetical protein J2W46_006713 [Paraburkholderia strydomiana]|nr:hypothetical protein [Paraburkholderia strydomiana]